MKITTGPQPGPQRCLITGVPGVGKSTFAAGAPDALFLQLERGVDHLDVAKTELLNDWEAVVEALTFICNENLPYKWLVIDTVTKLQEFIDRQTAKDNGVDNIEKIPYAKGKLYTMNYWKRVIEALKILNEKKGMGLILLAHAKTKQHHDPETDTFDKFILDMHDCVQAHLVQWADVVLFARYQTRTKQVDAGFGRTETKAIATAPRILRCNDRPTATAKNRLGLPDEIALDWNEFSKFLPKGA